LPMGIAYESTFEPSKDLLKILEDGLERHNESVVGKSTFVPVASFARDDSQEIIGGLSGRLFWDWLCIEQLWVAEGERGKGIGKHLVLEAERMALERGVRRSYLITMSFQALDFYLDLGYSVYGELGDRPAGHTTYYLRKNL